MHFNSANKLSRGRRRRRESLLKCYDCGGSKRDHDHTIINLGVLIVATTGMGGKIARSWHPLAAHDIIKLGVRAAMWNCYPAEMELDYQIELRDAGLCGWNN